MTGNGAIPTLSGVKPLGLLLPIATAFVLGSPAETAAAPGAYTNASLFAAAVPGGVSQVDFEGFTDGAVLSGTTQQPPGSTAQIVLPGPVADVLDPGGSPLALRVVVDATDNPARSGTRTLGVEDAGNFHAITAGTTLGFGFPTPVEAFGLTIITPEEPGAALFDGDLQLRVPGEATASLELGEGQLLGSFGGRDYRAYFVGVVGAAGFTTATLEPGATTPASSLFFNVDDLVVPVPEPGGVLGTLAGWGWLQCLRRAHRRLEQKRSTG